MRFCLIEHDRFPMFSGFLLLHGLGKSIVGDDDVCIQRAGEGLISRTLLCFCHFRQDLDRNLGVRCVWATSRRSRRVEAAPDPVICSCHRPPCRLSRLLGSQSLDGPEQECWWMLSCRNRRGRNMTTAKVVERSERASIEVWERVASCTPKR